MKLVEMSNLPTKAGDATLRFNPYGKEPKREGDIITLPRRKTMELFPLQGGIQYLVKIPEKHICPNCERDVPDYFRVFFLGTDERPFLVEMERQALHPFIKNGEEGFYEAIRPSSLEEVGVCLRKVHEERQGDIFALALNVEWKELLQGATETVSRFYNNAAMRYVSDERIFGTRHTLTGYIAPIRSDVLGSNTIPRYDWSVVEGTLEAPDHTPRKLEGPHVLAQTNLLRYPSLAD